MTMNTFMIGYFLILVIFFMSTHKDDDSNGIGFKSAFNHLFYSSPVFRV